MKNLYDFDTQASTSLYGGQTATRAAGLPTQAGLPGTFAPGGSNATADTLARMKQRTAGLMQGIAPQTPTPSEPILGYNPETNEVFSAGRTFKLDLDEGRRADQSGLFDIDNPQLPPGFGRVRAGNLRAKLQADFENQGIIDSIQRRAGGFAAGAGSTLRDLGIPGAQALEEAGAGLAARNPSQIQSAGDILEKPGTTAKEALSEAVGFDLPKAFATGAAGAKIGTMVAGPAGGVVGGLAGMGLSTLFETYGSIRREQREQGIDDKGRALLAGTGAAALETALGPEAAIGRIVGRAAAKPAGLLAAKDLLNRGMAKEVGKQIGIGAVVEGPLTEVPQTALERFGAYKPLTGAQAIDEYLIAGTKGAIGGGGMTAITASVEFQQTKAQAANFVENFMRDQQLAGDITADPVERDAAAWRVQQVLQGASTDPEFNQQLEQFRQKLQFLDYQAALAAGQPVNLLTDRPAFYERGEQVETKAAGDLSAYEAPPRLGREPRVQAPVEEAPLQQIETTRREDIQGPPVDEMSRLNNVLDNIGLQPFGAPGVFPPGPDTTLGGFEARPVQPPGAPQAPFGGDPTTLGGFEGAPAPTPLTETQQNFQNVLNQVPSLDLGTPAAPPQAPQPTAPAAEPLVQVETKLPTPAQSPAGSLPPAAPAAGALSAQDIDDIGDAQLAKVWNEAAATRMKGNPLAADVQGEKSVPVPGRPSLTTGALQRIRDILYNPNEATRAAARGNEEAIAEAVRNFALAAYKEANAGINLLRAVYTPKGKTEQTPAQVRGRMQGNTKQRADTNEAKQATTREALAELGRVVGNAKDVEVIVRMVKDAVQREVLFDKKQPTLRKEFVRLDTMLSSAWADAKAGKFQGETDRLQVSSRPVRDSKEERTKVSEGGDTRTKLQRIVSDGYAYFKGPTETGIAGLMNYLRQTAGMRPFQMTLAKSLHDVFDATGEAPNIEFVKSGNARYDPNTNTIYLREVESPEVILHEALHSALQWYVHTNFNNPKSEEIASLRKSLKAVINYKGDLPAKAKAVQQLLKKLVAEGNEADAVLELVSYGNTLQEFRQAMQAMPSKGVPESFRSAVTEVWNTIITAVQKLLGVEKSLATDVIEATFKLLESSTKQAPSKAAPRTGNILEAAITADAVVPMPTLEEAVVRPGGVAGNVNIEQFRKKVVPNWLSTEAVFKALGWGTAAKYTDKGVEAVGNYVRENFPKATAWISYVHSRFGVPIPVRGYFDQQKNDKQEGYKATELLANAIQSRPADQVLQIFAYLDGDKNAIKNDPALMELAEDVRNWTKVYLQDADQNTKDRFSGRKFSEALLFASNASQVASQKFGIRPITQVMGQKTHVDPALELAWLELTPEGDPMLDNTRSFYEVFTQAPDGTRIHQNFIDSAKYKRDGAPAGFMVDPSYEWKHVASKKKGDHTFVTSMTPAQALKENRAVDLANALRNTMAALSNNYSTRNFTQALVSFGRTPETEGNMPVVFDSIKDIEAALGGNTKINPDAVLNASSPEAASPRMQHLYRASHLWVRLPKGPAYGALAGKIVPSSLWSAMNDANDRQPVVKLRAFNDSMRWFKKAKTVHNPGTHVTNVATNLTLAYLHDIPVATVAKAAKLYAVYQVAPNKLTEQERQLMRAFTNSNAMLGDFSSAEVKEALYKSWADAVEGGSPSLVGRMAAFAKLEKNKAEALQRLASKGGKIAGKGTAYAEAYDNFMTEMYAGEDNVFRLAAFLKNAADRSANNGGVMTDKDWQAAGNFAKDAFLDYDIDSKAVRVLRQTAIPFISWTYAIMPVLGRIVVQQPWKVANLMLAYYMLEAALAGEDDEELRKKGPEYLRERVFGVGPYMHVRVPFLGDDQNPVWYRLGDYIPLATAVRGMPEGFMGISGWPGALTPSGPFLSALVAGITGRDTFTGQPLAPPTATDWEKFTALSKYVAGQFVPVPVTETVFAVGNTSKLENILKGRADMTDNYAALQMARWGGIKLYDYNVEQAQAAQSRAARAIMQEYQREIGRMRRAEARFENPDWEGFIAKQAELRDRMVEEMAKAKGEE